MLLRRVIEHLRRQEWTALNDARADRARAEGYLERIHDDLEADLTNYRDRLQFWRATSAYGRTCLAYVDSRDAGDLTQWELLLAYFQASQVAEFFTTDTTYEELKSAGELGLIADLDLRNSLARYYTNAGNPAMTELPAYRMHVRGAIPIDVQLYIWTNCYGSNANGEQEFRDCAAPIDETRAAQVVNAIRRDEALMSELRYWVSTLQVASQIGRDRTALATQVLAAVDAELGGASGMRVEAGANSGNGR